MTTPPTPTSSPRLIVELTPEGEYRLEYYLNGQRQAETVPAGAPLDFAIRDALAHIQRVAASAALARASYFKEMHAKAEAAQRNAEAKAAEAKAAQRDLHRKVYENALAAGHNGAWVDKYIGRPEGTRKLALRTKSQPSTPPNLQAHLDLL